MIDKLANSIHQTAKQKGWYEESRTFGEIIALCHSELSEALEEHRNSKPMIYDVMGKPEGVAIEMADVIIRILDWASSKGVSMEEAIQLKHEYNETRSYKHGGKTI